MRENGREAGSLARLRKRFSGRDGPLCIRHLTRLHALWKRTEPFFSVCSNRYLLAVGSVQCSVGGGRGRSPTREMHTNQIRESWKIVLHSMGLEDKKELSRQRVISSSVSVLWEKEGKSVGQKCSGSLCGPERPCNKQTLFLFRRHSLFTQRSLFRQHFLHTTLSFYAAPPISHHILPR